MEQAAFGTRARRRKLPQYVHRETTRHGKSVYYLRRGVGQRTRLQGLPGTPEFAESYKAALAGAPYEPKAKTAVEPEDPKRQQVERHLRRMLWGAADRARDKGRDFDIDLDWALARTAFKCPLTGIPFFMDGEVTARGVHHYAPSIDRVDCSKGYTKSNCRIVVFALNAMLLDWGEEVFRRVANSYRANRRKA